MNPPKAERAKPSLSSDYNLLFKNKIGESSLDIHRFLDESTNQLDDASAMKLIAILKSELPQTVVLMVSHQPAVKNLAETRIEIGGPALTAS